MSQITNPTSPADSARRGLEQLALGTPNDAIQLLLANEPPSPERIQQLNLFGISSIKRDKNGAMEIHFFDRLKALTALYELSTADDSSAAARSLLAALAGVGEDAHGV